MDVYGAVARSPFKALEALGDMFGRRNLAATVARQICREGHDSIRMLLNGEETANCDRPSVHERGVNCTRDFVAAAFPRRATLPINPSRATKLSRKQGVGAAPGMGSGVAQPPPCDPIAIFPDEPALKQKVAGRDYPVQLFSLRLTHNLNS